MKPSDLGHFSRDGLDQLERILRRAVRNIDNANARLSRTSRVEDARRQETKARITHRLALLPAPPQEKP